MYTDEEDRKKSIEQILASGVTSPALEQL